MRMQLVFGNGGWCEVRADDIRFHVRLAKRSGRLVVVELYLQVDPITPTLLRRLPLRHIESWVNTVPTYRDHVLHRLDYLAPDLATAVSYFSSGVTEPGLHWAGDMLLSQDDDSGVPRPPTPRRRTSSPPPPEATDPRLTQRPAGSRAQPYGDDFYAEIAAIYRGLVATSRNPAAQIADANGVAVTRVHRWVREARRRGLLPAPTPGKAG